MVQQGNDLDKTHSLAQVDTQEFEVRMVMPNRRAYYMQVRAGRS
jgi:hypothetical protein